MSAQHVHLCVCYMGASTFGAAIHDVKQKQRGVQQKSEKISKCWGGGMPQTQEIPYAAYIQA
jgi:hypothetical protein